MAGQMWMGPRGRETWVPAPMTGGQFGPVGRSTKTSSLNGGAGIDSSTSSHMEYNMSWTPTSGAILRPITDMYAGVRGPGLIYFTDLMEASQNVLPMSWAWPAQACYDAVPIVGDVRPSNVITVQGAFGFPYESARYLLDSSSVSKRLYLPIPQGFVAWVSASGSTAGPAVTVTPIAYGNVSSTPVNVAIMSPDENIAFTSFTGQGIELSLTGTGLITLSGLMVKMLPSGATPSIDAWISGGGNSGCKFEGPPVPTAYSSPEALDKVGMTAKLTEVGSWV
jgi:hypothetical protein